MGMFDTVKVAPGLLPIECPCKDFQTKDMENMLDLYEIRADGTLWREPLFIDPRWSEDNGMSYEEILADIEANPLPKVDRWEQLTDYHGRFLFYDWVDTKWGERGNILESDEYIFEATFTHGKLEDIRLISVTHYPKEKQDATG